MLDIWFPLIALFSGLFLQLSLQMPHSEQRLAKLHPIPGSYARMDRMSWILIIVGALWALQNLLV